MSDAQEANGFKGKVMIEDSEGNDVLISFTTTWNMTGDVRNQIDIPNYFGQTRDERIYTTLGVNTITFDAIHPATRSEGYDLLAAALENETELAENEIKFFERDADPEVYWTPDADSFIRIIGVNSNLTVPAGGVVTTSVIADVVGELRRISNPS